MPFYDYRCEKCGKIRTEQRKMIDANKPLECDSCKGRMKKLLPSVPIFYRADGFFTPRSS